MTVPWELWSILVGGFALWAFYEAANTKKADRLLDRSTWFAAVVLVTGAVFVGMIFVGALGLLRRLLEWVF